MAGGAVKDLDLDLGWESSSVECRGGFEISVLTHLLREDDLSSWLINLF